MKRIFRWCAAGLLACTALSARAEADLVQGISLADPTLATLALGGGDSWVADVSADGRYVVFVSRAPNLVEGKAVGGFLDVYVRDRTGQTTHLVSVNRQGTAGGNGHSNAPRISADGRFVVFESEAESLVWEDGNGAKDVFLRDMVEGRTELISVSASGTRSGNGASWWPIMTPDGAHVAFMSVALPGTRSVTGAGHADMIIGSVSADGRFVAFFSYAENLVSNDGNGTWDVFVRDLVEGSTVLVSVNHAGTGSGNRASLGGMISADGRYVAFTSLATDLVDGLAIQGGNVYVRDLVEQRTQLVSINSEGTGSGNSGAWLPVISADGSHVAFSSYATNLVADPEVSQWRTKLYVRNLHAAVTTLVAHDASVGAPLPFHLTQQVCQR